jgi:hypothetical protein
MNSPTPETDAIWNSDGNILEHARKLERERSSALQSSKDNAANFRASEVRRIEAERKRDEARKHSWNDMVCVNHTDLERAACIGHCPICAEKERDQLRKVADAVMQWQTVRQDEDANFEDLNDAESEVISSYNQLPHVIERINDTQ